MAAPRPPPEIFQADQYFWCHEDNERVDKWIADNCGAYPKIYPIYINDANMVLQRERDGRPQSRDEHMLTFLENYPMNSHDIIDELTWYKAKVLEKSHYQMTGLINVNQHGKLLQIFHLIDLVLPGGNCLMRSHRSDAQTQEF